MKVSIVQFKIEVLYRVTMRKSMKRKNKLSISTKFTIRKKPTTKRLIMKKNKSFKNLNILKIIKQKPKKSTNMNMKSLINSIKSINNIIMMKKELKFNIMKKIKLIKKNIKNTMKTTKSMWINHNMKF